jgi:hypothetical protein
MFGKQSPYLPQQDPITIRPAEMIVEDLCQLADLDWAKYAFSREPLNGKFNDSQRLELAQKAIDCGTKAADELIAKHGVREPVELARAMGVTVSYPDQPQNAERVLFAEFCPPLEINIFMHTIDQAKELLQDPVVSAAVGHVRISDILLGHELFHVVEERQIKEIWTKTHKIDLWGIGPLRNRSRIVVLSEIAAMGFSKRLNGLPYLPYVMDAFLVYGYSAEMASRLYEEMMGYAGQEARRPV